LSYASNFTKSCYNSKPYVFSIQQNTFASFRELLNLIFKVIFVK